MTMITGAKIPLFRLMVLYKGIELEGKTGMRMSRGRSCLAIVKKEFGWKGNRSKILFRLANVINEQEALQEEYVCEDCSDYCDCK